VLGRIEEWLGFADADRHHGDGHAHGIVEPSIATTERGIWAVKWSFVLLIATAALQAMVVIVSGSIALLADTIHNVGDAGTAIPLWIAFVLARRKPSPRFPYGLGRVEDLAGVAVVLIILASALVAGYEAIDRLLHPQTIHGLGWVALAGVIGFLGNEAVAVFRIRVGRQIDSAALIADGYHARADGLTSLAVVLGAAGVWLGYPLADPVVGLVITAVILAIVWQSAKAVLTRMLDGIDVSVLDLLRHSAENEPRVRSVVGARARWIGHRLHGELTLALDTSVTPHEANEIAEAIRSHARGHLPALERLVIEATLAD
jgi:cation diffusion facilitator family transporter